MTLSLDKRQNPSLRSKHLSIFLVFDFPGWVLQPDLFLLGAFVFHEVIKSAPWHDDSKLLLQNSIPILLKKKGKEFFLLYQPVIDGHNLWLCVSTESIFQNHQDPWDGCH